MSSGVELFVPRIVLFDISGELKSGVIWTDGIPALLPEVDVAIVPRLVLSSDPGRDIVIFHMNELLPVFSGYTRTREDPPAWCLDYRSTPNDIEALIRSKAQMTESVSGIAMDQVLNRELVDDAKTTT